MIVTDRVQLSEQMRDAGVLGGLPVAGLKLVFLIVNLLFESWPRHVLHELVTRIDPVGG